MFVRYVVLERDLRTDLPAAEAPPGIDLALLTPAGIGAYTALRPDTPLATVERRLAAGHDCYVLRLGGAIVAAVWVRFDALWLPVIGRPLELPPGAAYAYDSYTAHDRRRQGLATLRSSLMHPLLRARGCTSLRAGVFADNRAGVRAALAAGYTPVRDLRWLHLGPLGLGWQTGVEERRLRLRLPPRAPELPPEKNSPSRWRFRPPPP